MSQSYFGFIFLIASLLGGNVFAQADYLITTKGDTLKGQIGFQMLSKIEQAVVKGDKRQAVSAIQTREVLLKGTRYKPVHFGGFIRFMKILSEGYVSKLAFQPEGISSYDGILLQKSDGAMLEVPNLGFKKQLSAFLKDHESLSKKIEDGEFNRNDLDKIILEYNQFISEKTKITLSQNQIVQPQNFNQNRKNNLELLSGLKEEVMKVEFQSKQDVLGMLADVEEKITNGKEIPNYLVQSLKSSLADQPALLQKLEKFFVDLK